MYAITGITGKVGGALAKALIEAGEPVRAVLRDPAKAEIWRKRGCEIAFAEMGAAAQLAAAFKGATGVFILPPSEFDPAPGYPEAAKQNEVLTTALLAARPERVVCLSTIGADGEVDNLLSQRAMLEEALGELDFPVTFLRPGWFMENAAWDVAPARDEGVLHSFLQPADKTFAMVATQDIGRLAADLIREGWTGKRVVELEGPSRVSPNDLANAFASALGHPVRVEIVPRESWEGLFRAQGTRNPQPRMRMLDGFNEGWIDFKDNGHNSVKGKTPLVEVIAALVRQAAATEAV
ncbi:MAG: NmrA family transcriptional regulator [Mesorhizobium sp.]|uniref:NmrA family NAD(P)-binding protein n=4 Tax=unclassified Mesorhizobium TaxID=325217 RepID=UPI000FE7DF14|nr:NmrA family NAD(P)-binding protein [Mesorhizobium sp.]RWN26797.1 MAG: NmrA family transcriptional regulator [Mesorhizobium sp.]